MCVDQILVDDVDILPKRNLKFFFGIWSEDFSPHLATSCNYRFSVEPRISAAAAAALFFSSEAETPDSDPECEQPEELWREMVQNVTVGVLSAFLGDMVWQFQVCVQVVGILNPICIHL